MIQRQIRVGPSHLVSVLKRWEDLIKLNLRAIPSRNTHAGQVKGEVWVGMTHVPRAEWSEGYLIVSTELRVPVALRFNFRLVEGH